MVVGPSEPEHVPKELIFYKDYICPTELIIEDNGYEVFFSVEQKGYEVIVQNAMTSTKPWEMNLTMECCKVGK